MIKIKSSPVILCRTKYIDYKEQGFIWPQDFNRETFNLLVHLMHNGHNLGSIESNKVFIHDGTHCLIGKIGFLNNLLSEKLAKSIDLSLDKEREGRMSWGFIGVAIRINDFIHNKSNIDLSDDYYSYLYKAYLYDNHWLDREPINGPYNYPYEDVCFVEKNIEQNTLNKFNTGKEWILESDKCNEELFNLAIYKALQNEIVSYCSNAEYNAHQLIREHKVNIVTASDSNLGLLRSVMKSPTVESRKKANKDVDPSKRTIEKPKRSRLREDSYVQNSEIVRVQAFNKESSKSTYDTNNRTIFEFLGLRLLVIQRGDFFEAKNGLMINSKMYYIKRSKKNTTTKVKGWSTNERTENNSGNYKREPESQKVVMESKKASTICSYYFQDSPI